MSQIGTGFEHTFENEENILRVSVIILLERKS